MTYEIPAGSGEVIDLPNFYDVIAEQIDLRGDDNKPKPSIYKQPPILSILASDVTYEGRDGQINFAPHYRTHRMFLDDTELIYICRPLQTGRGEAKFIVHQAGESKLASRTTFEIGEDSRVHKKRQTTYGVDGFIEFSRPLESEELTGLVRVVQDPVANHGALYQLIGLNAEEQRLAAASRAKYDLEERKMAETIRALEFARARGVHPPKDIVIHGSEIT